MSGFVASPQPTIQKQQQLSKNSDTSEPISTLQALEQMPVAPIPGVMQTFSTDYALSYSSSARQMQHNVTVNPLSPMTCIPPSWETSRQYDHEWLSMNQTAMNNFNHLQISQMNMLPQQQLANVFQMPEMSVIAPNRGEQLSPNIATSAQR